MVFYLCIAKDRMASISGVIGRAKEEAVEKRRGEIYHMMESLRLASGLRNGNATAVIKNCNCQPTTKIESGAPDLITGLESAVKEMVGSTQTPQVEGRACCIQPNPNQVESIIQQVITALSEKGMLCTSHSKVSICENKHMSEKCTLTVCNPCSDLSTNDVPPETVIDKAVEDTSEICHIECAEYIDAQNFKDEIENSLRNISAGCDRKIALIEKATMEIELVQCKRLKKIEKSMEDMESSYKGKMKEIKESIKCLEETVYDNIRRIQKSAEEAEDSYFSKINLIENAAKTTVLGYAKAVKKIEQDTKTIEEVYNKKLQEITSCYSRRGSDRLETPNEGSHKSKPSNVAESCQKKKDRSILPTDISMNRRLYLTVAPGISKVSVSGNSFDISNNTCTEHEPSPVKTVGCCRLKNDTPMAQVDEESKKICKHDVNVDSPKPRNAKERRSSKARKEYLLDGAAGLNHKHHKHGNKNGEILNLNPTCNDPAHYKVLIRGLDCPHCYYTCLTCASHETSTWKCQLCGKKAWHPC